jgi:hypothetical protein
MNDNYVRPQEPLDNTKEFLTPPEQNIETMLDSYIGPQSEGKSIEEKKFIALYMARRVIYELGTVPEKLSASKHIKRMRATGK